MAQTNWLVGPQMFMVPGTTAAIMNPTPFVPMEPVRTATEVGAVKRPSNGELNEVGKNV